MGGKKEKPPSDQELRKMSGPWLPLQDPLKLTIGEARGLYDQGDMTWGNNVVQPWTAQQQAAYQGATNLAAQGQPQFGQATNFAAGVAGGGQLGQVPGTDVLAGAAANGTGRPARSAYEQLLARTQAGSGGMDYLQRAARGEFMGGNPHLEGQIDAASRGITERFNSSVMPGIESRMAMAGRLDSGAEQDMAGMARRDLATGLGEVETGIRFGEYGRERGMQQQAGMALPGALATETGAGLAAANGLSGDAWQELQGRINAATQLGAGHRADTGQALAAGQGLGQLYQQQFAPYEQAMKYGAMQQGQAERQAAEAQARHRFEQDAGWTQLQRLIGTYNQIGGQTNPAIAGNVMAQYAGQPGGPSAGMSAATGALSGASTGAMFGPWGALIGAGVGAAGGYYGAQR